MEDDAKFVCRHTQLCCISRGACSENALRPAALTLFGTFQSEREPRACGVAVALASRETHLAVARFRHHMRDEVGDPVLCLHSKERADYNSIEVGENRRNSVDAKPLGDLRNPFPRLAGDGSNIHVYEFDPATAGLRKLLARSDIRLVRQPSGCG